MVNHLTEADLESLGITRESVEQMLDADEAGAWCVDVQGDVVGFSLAFRDEREVSALFVLPDYEQRGFGAALLDEAVRWLEGHSREPIRLVTDRSTPAYRFYEARGWVDLGYGPDDVAFEGDIYMEYTPRIREAPALE